jgi:Major Facilitator Superfamily
VDTKPIALSSSTQQPVAQEGGRRLHGVALISVLIALMLTLLLEALDQTVVGTALPRIIGSLQGFDRYTWAVTAYTLASITMIPIVGKLSDQFGRKWFLITGTAAVRYLGQLGAVLGVAIVGTVVNQTLSSDIVKRLPAATVQQLTPGGLKFATNPQVLVNPTYRESVVHTAQRFAVRNAVAHIPPGPQHDQIAVSVAAQAMQQAQHLLNQVFEALRLSLSVAIQHGFIAVLLFCGVTIVVTFFLKDVPMTKQFSEAPDEAKEATESEESERITTGAGDLS